MVDATTTLKNAVTHAAVEIFVFLQQLNGAHTAITGGALVDIGDCWAEPRVTEPDIFSRWQWFSLNELPDRLFPASEALLRVRMKASLLSDWCTYTCSPTDMNIGV